MFAFRQASQQSLLGLRWQCIELEPRKIHTPINKEVR